jgi:hypothetical protein
VNNKVGFSMNILHINEFQTSFTHDIRKVCQNDGKVFVLLSIPYDDDTIDNIYATTLDCKILWRIQSIKEFYQNYLPLPYVHMVLESNELRATDFCGRRVLINPDDGKIIKRDFVK